MVVMSPRVNCSGVDIPAKPAVQWIGFDRGARDLDEEEGLLLQQASRDGDTAA